MSFLSFKKIIELVIEQAKHISTINELVTLLGYKGFTNIERVFQILEEDDGSDKRLSWDAVSWKTLTSKRKPRAEGCVK
jgi:hypothetical protein